MLSHISRTQVVSALCVTTIAAVAAVSLALGASVFTTGLLLLICVAPLAVVLLMGFGAPPPTVAELLYSVNSSKPTR